MTEDDDSDAPPGRSVCETQTGLRQLITLAIKHLPSRTSNYFSKTRPWRLIYEVWEAIEKTNKYLLSLMINLKD